MQFMDTSCYNALPILKNHLCTLCHLIAFPTVECLLKGIEMSPFSHGFAVPTSCVLLSQHSVSSLGGASEAFYFFSDSDATLD